MHFCFCFLVRKDVALLVATSCKSACRRFWEECSRFMTNATSEWIFPKSSLQFAQHIVINWCLVFLFSQSICELPLLNAEYSCANRWRESAKHTPVALLWLILGVWKLEQLLLLCKINQTCWFFWQFLNRLSASLLGVLRNVKTQYQAWTRFSCSKQLRYLKYA